MDERELNPRLPNEVVETYRRQDPREVVEVYTRPLPGLKEEPAPPRKRSRRGLWIFLACFGLALILAGAAWGLGRVAGRIWTQPFEKYAPEPVRGETETGVSIPSWPVGQDAKLAVSWEHGEPITIQEVYQRVNPAVVAVLAQLKEGVSAGTGVIFTEDGYILTNYHVVEGGTDCVVALADGRRYETMYVAGDKENDLAVLKVDMEGLPAAEFGDSDLLTVGDPVYAIGNPLGVELRGTLTDGIVSAINRDVRVDGRTMTLIQTNAALNSGNSGGPLINQYGQVVGINVIKMSSRYSNVEGLGFAIPSASMDRIINDLLTYGEVKPEPLLGITVATVGVKVAEERTGIEVLELTPGGAGDLGGVEKGDFILSAGGIETATSQDLLRARRQYHLGDEMPMVLWRDGREVEVTLKLEQAVE